MNISVFLERAATLFPEQEAIIFEQQRISYQVLHEMVNCLANGLSRVGISSGDRVVLFLPNIPDFIVSYLAAQKIGAIAVSINAQQKGEEVHAILQDCLPRVVITTAELRSELIEHDLEFLDLLLIVEGEVQSQSSPHNVQEVTLEAFSESHSPVFQAIPMERDDPAAILYTSGTTGISKGATLSHGNVISNTHSFTYNCGVTSKSRILLYLPLFHCFGQNALMNTAISAAATIILQRRYQPDTALKAVAEEHVSQLYGVPSVFLSLLEVTSPEQINSVNYCFSAAAPLPVEVARKWQEKYGLPIHEGYGLTETSPFASYNHILRYKIGSIGAPIENVEMKVVNFDGREVAPGELGEIVIRGPNVMLGYWNRPAETDAVILDGWFHSGDIGKMDEQGYYYIVDRIKDMINVDGMKVYPVEVENVFYLHPAVSEVAVYGAHDNVLGEQVRASIVVKRDEQVEATELIRFAKEHLADFKVPVEIEFIDQIPKNPAGKVLKRVLRERSDHGKLLEERQRVSNAVSTEGTMPPALGDVSKEDIEQWILEWLNQTLDPDEKVCDTQETFFNLGLTSVMAVKLARELSDWMGYDLMATVTWNYSTIEALSEYLSETRRGSTDLAAKHKDDGVSTTTTVTQQDIDKLSDNELLAALRKELD